MSKKSKAKKAAHSPSAVVHAEASAATEFANKSAKRDSARHAKQAKAHTRRKLPNWLLLVPALLGVLLAGYLTYTAWASEKLAYCGAGSGCDLVQSSRWSTLFGAPVAFWGLLAYLSLAYIAWRVRDTVRHWQAAWLVAIPSLGVSLYLTGVSLFAIGATCFYCLTSLGLLTVVVGILAWQSRGVPGIAWPAWLGQTVGLAAVLVVLLHLHYSGVFSKSAGPEDPYLKGLAEHLKAEGVQFYGASWCPHCQEQKEMFGTAAARLPYVECSPNGPNAPQAGVCIAQGVQSYPTWIFKDEKHSGTLTPAELAKQTGYPPPPVSK